MTNSFSFGYCLGIFVSSLLSIMWGELILAIMLLWVGIITTFGAILIESKGGKN